MVVASVEAAAAATDFTWRLDGRGQPVQVSGIMQLKFTAGSDCHGNLLGAKTNQAVLQQNGADVTAQIVVKPGP